MCFFPLVLDVLKRRRETERERERATNSIQFIDFGIYDPFKLLIKASPGDLFRESVEYLRQLGALEGEEFHVLMPNYMLGPSNCDGTTSFYDLCCPNACEVHKGHLERAMMADPFGDHVSLITRAVGERLGDVSSEMLQWLEQLAKDCLVDFVLGCFLSLGSLEKRTSVSHVYDCIHACRV